MIEFAQHTLLLVEDSPADRLIVQEFLLEDGLQPPVLLEAEDLRSAVTLLNEAGIDLVLLDLGLPDSTGLATLQQLRRCAPAVPVMVFTGLDDEETALEALREGATDYLVKGSESARSLRRAVRMALEREQLRAELEEHHQRLRDRDARLRALVETAQDAIISCDERGRILYWNRGAQVMFGYTVEEALDQPLSLIIPPEFHRVDPDVPAPALGSKGDPTPPTGIREFTARRKDGSAVPVELALSEWREKGQRRVTAILRDVEERSAARDAIEGLSQEYELLLTSAGQGIIGVDVSGTVTFANPAACTLTGWTLGQIVGQSSHDLLHHSDGVGHPSPSDSSALRRCLDHAAEIREETRFRNADGSSFPVAVTFRPILRDQTIHGAVLVFEDISSRLALEEQLRHAQKMEVVGSLSGGIAHDFNNELAIIVLNAGMALAELQRGLPVDPEGIAEIKAAADRATRITQQLLGFSRRAPLELRPTDLRGIVDRLSSILEKLLPERIQLVVEPLPDPCVSQVDPSVVEQALLNLATNARDAMPEGGRLEIGIERFRVEEGSSTEAAGEYHTIVVRDTGVGMDAATLEKATVPFFTTKPQGKGTGLGLSMVYGLTQQMGGFLRLASQPGKGTTARICLPASNTRARYDDAPAVQATTDGAGKVVLLVEDEPNLREACARVLGRCGYKVLAAEDGNEALRLFEANAAIIDVVLSDLGMPGLGGRELHDELTKLHGPIPFVFTTGYAEASAVDGRPILIKPWPVDVLLETLEAEVRRGRSSTAQAGH